MIIHLVLKALQLRLLSNPAMCIYYTNHTLGPVCQQRLSASAKIKEKSICDQTQKDNRVIPGIELGTSRTSNRRLRLLGKPEARIIPLDQTT